MTNTLPFSLEQIQEIKKSFPTPFHLYQEKELVDHAKRFQQAFSVFPGFKEYFAVKATPNPIILKLLKEILLVIYISILRLDGRVV